MTAYRLHLTQGGTVDVEADSENAAASGYMVSVVEELVPKPWTLSDVVYLITRAENAKDHDDLKWALAQAKKAATALQRQ